MNLKRFFSACFHSKNKQKIIHFLNHNYNSNSDMYSDGFVDQIGGAKGHKFKSKNFKQLLLNNSQLSMTEQNQMLSHKLKTWKADYQQIDDILVIVIKI